MILNFYIFHSMGDKRKVFNKKGDVIAFNQCQKTEKMPREEHSVDVVASHGNVMTATSSIPRRSRG
jgi:hypothetical protein